MTKELSKVPLVKKLIALDPHNPGVVSQQRYTNKAGKKSRIYYLWQSSILGQKVSIRLPRESVQQIKDAIASAETKTKSEDSKTISALKAYKKALETLMERNKKIRLKNADDTVRSGKEETARKSEVKALDKIIKKNQSK